jgi:hypothetical protein
MCMRSQVKIQKRALVIFVFLGTWSFSDRHTKLASKKAFNFFYATHWYAYCLTVPAACSPLKLRIIRKQARVYFVDGETVLLRKKKNRKEEDMAMWVKQWRQQLFVPISGCLGHLEPHRQAHGNMTRKLAYLNIQAIRFASFLNA